MNCFATVRIPAAADGQEVQETPVSISGRSQSWRSLTEYSPESASVSISGRSQTWRSPTEYSPELVSIPDDSPPWIESGELRVDLLTTTKVVKKRISKKV